MPIYLGNKAIETMYYNNKPIESAYYGSTLVYSSFTPETVRFDYTGAVQTWTVPKGCKKLLVDCVGAAGGSASTDAIYRAGGLGGRVLCDLTVSAGQILYIYVGGVGVNSPVPPYGGTATGGFNGGGNGGFFSYNSQGGGGGGGSTDIRLDGDGLSTRVVVAGGGGGGFVSSSGNVYGYVGGNGGGLTGQDSGSTSESNLSAGGGTQTSGGRGGGVEGYRGEAGSLGKGGNSYEGSMIGFLGAGGGSGYYGGGGGGSSAPGGAGGSSYTDPALCTNVIHTQGYSEASGNGWIIITTSK